MCNPGSQQLAEKSAAPMDQQEGALDHSQHEDQPHGMAQITATGLRLTDAEGTSSLVPLDELREVMMKLTFSR